MNLLRDRPQPSAHLLKPSEWWKLEPLAEHFGYAIPKPNQAQILVTEVAGEIVGFAVLEPIVHFGPVWVKPEYRRGKVFNGLCKESYILFRRLFPNYRGAVAYSTNSQVLRVAQALGFKKVEAVPLKWEE